MTIALVTTGNPAMHFGSLFQIDAFATLNAAGRQYSLFRVSGRGADASFVDPVDGALLIALNYFTSESAARAWVEADIALRSMQQ